jgi:hypothetical protein
MADAGYDFHFIVFDLHPPAAAVALLTPPQFPIDCGDLDRHTGRQPGQKSHQALSVRLAGSFKA